MRLGIYGGAFNPVHNGHIIIAIQSLEYLNLDKLIIVPTFDPPHRSSSILASFEKRYDWLLRVFGGIEKIEISDYEKVKGGKSYTIETVRHFKEIYGVKPIFIMGEDSAVNFHTWYRYEVLLKEAIFAVYPRFRKSRYEEISRLYPDFILMDLPLIEISASEIRERVREGKSIRGLIPREIEEEVIRVFC